MKTNSKIKALVTLACLLLVSATPACTKSNEQKGKEMGKKIGAKFDQVEDAAKRTGDHIQEKGKEFHDKAKDKAHDLIDKA